MDPRQPNPVARALFGAGCILSSFLSVAFTAANAAVPEIPPGQSFTISENLPAGTVVGTVQASDPEGDPIFLFVVGDEDDGWNFLPVPFEFDAGTRILRTKAPLNFEHRQAWGLLVGATDGGGLPGATQIISVVVQDVGGEPIVGPGAETYGEHPDYVGSESILMFKPLNFGTLPENRPIDFSFLIPPGARFLGGSGADGWSCSHAPGDPKAHCVRDDMLAGENTEFLAHFLLPAVPGAVAFPFAIVAGDYVHFDHRTSQVDVWPHPAPGNVALSIAPEALSAEVGQAFSYSLHVSDSSDPSLPSHGAVIASIDLGSAWGPATFNNTHPSWSCAQQSTLVRCMRASLGRGTSAPPIVINVLAPAASGIYPVTAWVSGPPDSDTGNNVARHDTVAHQRPMIEDQSFLIPGNTTPGAKYGPLVATDDQLPAPATLTYAKGNLLQASPFSIQPDGMIVQVGAVTPGASYSLTVRVIDGGGLSDTAIARITVSLPAGGCGGSDNDGDNVCDEADLDDDNDGKPDLEDPCPLDAQDQCCGPQGDQACSAVDTDGDGIPDAEDNCDAVPNASQTNTDHDAHGDACDTDDDNDGNPDVMDVCPLDATDSCTCSVEDPDTDGDLACNSSDTDDDGDGTPDVEDACPLDAANHCCGPQGNASCEGEEGGTDDDGDGVPNVADNCDAVPNPSQTNTDGDDLGDACDSDDDGDGQLDEQDLCPLDATNSCGGRIFRDGFEGA